MATRLYGISVGQQNTDVLEFVGSATTSAFINVTIDFGSVVNDGGGTRKPKLSEVVDALENLKEYILRQNSFPPA